MPKISKKQHYPRKIIKYTHFIFDSLTNRTEINSQQKNNTFKKDVSIQTCIANRYNLKEYLINNYLDNDLNFKYLELTTSPKQNIANYCFNIKTNISNLTWGELYNELSVYSLKEVAKRLGYNSEMDLRLVFARTSHGFDRFDLNDFKELSPKNFQHLFLVRANSQIGINSNFNPTRHSLATIHYFVNKYQKIDLLRNMIVSLGFTSFYSLIAFLSRSSLLKYMAYEELILTSPLVLKKRFGDCYYKPLDIDTFKRFNYSLSQLKSLLDKGKSLALTMAELGEEFLPSVNLELEFLKYLGINIKLETLCSQEFEGLRGNIDKRLLKTKLCYLLEEVKMKISCPNTYFSFPAKVVDQAYRSDERPMSSFCI